MVCLSVWRGCLLTDEMGARAGMCFAMRMVFQELGRCRMVYGTKAGLEGPLLWSVFDTKVGKLRKNENFPGWLED